MKLVAYDIKKLGVDSYCYQTDNFRLIEEFANSDMDCAKVEGWKHKTISGCTASLNKSIKTLRKNGIRAIARKGQVYLIKIKTTK